MYHCLIGRKRRSAHTVLFLGWERFNGSRAALVQCRHCGCCTSWCRTSWRTWNWRRGCQDDLRTRDWWTCWCVFTFISGCIHHLSRWTGRNSRGRSGGVEVFTDCTWTKECNQDEDGEKLTDILPYIHYSAKCNNLSDDRGEELLHGIGTWY